MQQRIRPLVAIAVATAMFGSLMIAPVFAQSSAGISSEIECDPITGEYVATYTLTAGSGPQDIQFGGWELLDDDDQEIEGGDLQFNVTVLGANESATAAEVRLPGTSVGTLNGYAQLADEGYFDVDDVLDGTCVAAPTTTTTAAPTTTTTMVAPTTTAPAQPVAAVVAVPTYTG